MAELDPSTRLERTIEEVEAERRNDWLIFGLVLAAGIGVSGFIWNWLDQSLIANDIRTTLFVNGFALVPAGVWIRYRLRKTGSKLLPILASLHGFTYVEKMISLKPFMG